MVTAKAKKKIILIEDENSVIEMYQIQFNQSGYDIKIARNTKDGLDLVTKDKFDLILLDIILPTNQGATAQLDTRGGYRFLEEIKKNPELKKIPVIMLTNLDSPGDRKRAKKLGTNGYYIKAEFIPREVVEIVDRFFKKNK